jgi:hypothetical protein
VDHRVCARLVVEHVERVIVAKKKKEKEAVSSRIKSQRLSGN